MRICSLSVPSEMAFGEHAVPNYLKLYMPHDSAAVFIDQQPQIPALSMLDRGYAIYDGSALKRPA